MKVTERQRQMMRDAARFDYQSSTGRVGTWFYPDLSNSEVYGTQATAKALCKHGLLEYHVTIPQIGKFPALLGFRITDAGRKWVDEH